MDNLLADPRIVAALAVLATVAVLGIGVGVARLLRRRSSSRRPTAGEAVSPSAPVRPADIRVLSVSAAVPRASNSASVRVTSSSSGRTTPARPEPPINTSPVATVRTVVSPQVAPPPSTPIVAAAPVPAHAECPWCGDRIMNRLAERGGFVQCPRCHFFMHRSCFAEHDERCGGRCRI